MRENPNSRLTPRASRLLYSARVAHFATTDKFGRPHVIPICFVFDGKKFYSPIDEKPKRTTQLKRVKNIAENPNVALVIDHYAEDWRKLAYVLVIGMARVLSRGSHHRRAIKLLRQKYQQYRTMALENRPVIEVTAQRVIPWSGAKL